jgi:hypothetical protein
MPCWTLDVPCWTLGPDSERFSESLSPPRFPHANTLLVSPQRRRALPNGQHPPRVLACPRRTERPSSCSSPGVRRKCLTLGHRSRSVSVDCWLIVQCCRSQTLSCYWHIHGSAARVAGRSKKTASAPQRPDGHTIQWIPDALFPG